MTFSKHFNIIVACTFDGGIGYNNYIPWNIKAELKKFREITIKVEDKKKINAVIMGSKTWISLQSKPLKGRLNIVLTSTYRNELDYPNQNVKFVQNFEEALSCCKYDVIENIFVIGGAKVYDDILYDNYYINKINKIYLTVLFYDERIKTNKSIDLKKIFQKFKLIKDTDYEEEHKNRIFSSYIAYPK